ncbi:MAG: LamG-like jellyroll fold domain-containing protein [Bacteroidota bacterium]
MIGWYYLLFVMLSLRLVETPPRIVSFSTPSEITLHEPFNVVLNVFLPSHTVDRSAPQGGIGFLLHIPKDWEIHGISGVSRGKLEELRRYEDLESFFQPEMGYQLIGVSLADLPSENDEMLWKIILTVVPRSVGSYPLKVISCSQFESERGPGWKASEPPDFAGFRQLESENLVEVVSVDPPQYNGGQAVALRNGADAMRIEPVDLPLFVADKDFTVEFWLKTTSLDVSVLGVTGSRLEDPEPSGTYLGIDAEGMPILTAREGDSMESLMADGIIADGSWHHVALVHRADSRTLLLFVDGSWTGSLVVSRFPLIQPAALSLGALYRKGFVGNFDELRVWSAARSADQVRHDMGRVLQSGPVGLVGLYHFDELSGTVAANELRVGLPDATLDEKAKFVASDSPAVREMFRLSAELRGKEIVLKWQLSSIDGVDEFAVERRAAGESFQEVGKVDVLSSLEGQTSPVFNYVDMVMLDVVVVKYRIKARNIDGSIQYSNEVKVGTGIPFQFTLGQNHPNPFNPSTIIPYTIHIETQVRLRVYDLVGREVGVLVDQRQGPGTYAVEFDVEDHKGLTSGIYFYKLETERQSEIRKMILAK